MLGLLPLWLRFDACLGHVQHRFNCNKKSPQLSSFGAKYSCWECVCQRGDRAIRLEDASAGRRTFSAIHLWFMLMWMPCFCAVVCHFMQKYEWTHSYWYDIESFPRHATYSSQFVFHWKVVVFLVSLSFLFLRTVVW